MWRYRELLPLPAEYSALPPNWIHSAGQRAASRQESSDRGSSSSRTTQSCLPTLSFKDRVVAVALANARSFGSIPLHVPRLGNLANSVAAQAAREGFKAWIFIPLRPRAAKILGTQVFGAELVRINGSYDHVIASARKIADEHRWGFVNVNLRPYYSEGSKTVGYEIAEGPLVFTRSGQLALASVANSTLPLTYIRFVRWRESWRQTGGARSLDKYDTFRYI